METFQPEVILEKFKWKLQLGMSWSQSEWLVSKTPQTVNAGEVLEKKKLSYIDASNVHC